MEAAPDLTIEHDVSLDILGKYIRRAKVPCFLCSGYVGTMSHYLPLKLCSTVLLWHF